MGVIILAKTPNAKEDKFKIVSRPRRCETKCQELKLEGEPTGLNLEKRPLVPGPYYEFSINVLREVFLEMPLE